MFVKALRMAGFKSFADPTILEFDRGLNVIVGPNGSGKSNIADALAWVLGSQAPTSLRGGSMEDVIFAGSGARPRLGLAEVELTLDNSSRTLPLDLNEVTIARMTDRSGDSEYRINGAPCRLLDVTELLSDTGIGRSIHTVVGQGALDDVLQARPEDRRALIEEAAQIGKYRRRKERSLKKIERVDENVARLTDVLTELRRALRPLKRQASQASLYSELMAEHQTTKQRLAATEIGRLRAATVQEDPEREGHRARLLTDELASVRARLESATSERAARAEDADRRRTVSHRMTRATDRLAGLARIAEERVEATSARLAAETEEGYRERIRLLEAERARWSSESTTLGAGARAMRDTANQAAAALAGARGETASADRRLTAARGAETEAAQALVRAEGGEAAGRSTLGSIEARVDAIVERRDVATRELATAASALAAAEEEVRTLEAELDVATERSSAIEASMDESRHRLDRVKADRGDVHARVAAADARLAALAEVVALLEANAGPANIVRPLLDDARSRAQIIQNEAGGTEAALEQALAEFDDLSVEVARQDDELRRLDALMAGSADRLAGARRLHERRETELAAYDEELSRAREAMAAAEREATEQRAALPGHRAALRAAQDERNLAERTAHDARQTEEVAARAATEAAMEARSAEERALAAQLRLEEAQAGIADAEAALSSLEHLRRALRQQRDSARETARVARDAAGRGIAWSARAQKNAVAAHEEAEAWGRNLAQLSARERELSRRLEDVNRRRSEAEVRRAQHEARLEALGERSMDDWGLSLDDLRSIGAFSTDEEIAEAHERVQQLEREMKRVGPVNPRAAQEYQELAERENFLVEQVEDLRSSRRDLMKVIREVDDTILDVFGEAYRAVASEFEDVFGRLFPGGTGRLKLTDPDDLLSSGIEVEARPPGKNIKKMSLLSGGERSLVALAFLFAIFRSRPSPFYLLDEVEAALDDINLQRFIRLVKELEQRAQVLIVTHQKRTMEAAGVLYGVSMSKDGVSRVIAKRMEDVEQVGV
jgi:chromosome segregation protein